MPYFHTLSENGELPHRAKLVCLYLFGRKDRDGKAGPGVNRMAADLSVSRSTVKRAIKDLEKAELIRKEAHFRENGNSILFAVSPQNEIPSAEGKLRLLGGRRGGPK